MNPEIFTSEDIDREVHHHPAAPRGSDRSFVEAQKLGLLGHHEPEGERAVRVQPTINELAAHVRLLKDQRRAATAQRARLTEAVRLAKARKQELARAIASDKEELIGVVGTDQEHLIVERLARSRQELLSAGDRLEASEMALKGLPDGFSVQADHTREIATRSLHIAVEAEELKTFDPAALAVLHSAFSIQHMSAADWPTWVGSVLTPPDSKALASMRAEVLAKHNVEV